MDKSDSLQISRGRERLSIYEALAFLLPTLIAGAISEACGARWHATFLVMALAIVATFATVFEYYRGRARRTSDLWLEYRAAHQLLVEERPDDCERACRALFKRCVGRPAVQAMCVWSISIVDMARGELEASLEHVDEVRSSGAFDGRELLSQRWLLHSSLAISHALLDHRAEARSALDDARADAGELRPPFLAYVEYYVLLREGEDAAAAAHVEQHWSALDRGLTANQLRWVCALRAFASDRRALGEAEVARWIARALPPEARVLRNFSSHWPELREFFERRGLLALESAQRST